MIFAIGVGVGWVLGFFGGVVLGATLEGRSRRERPSQFPSPDLKSENVATALRRGDPDSTWREK